MKHSIIFYSEVLANINDHFNAIYQKVKAAEKLAVEKAEAYFKKQDKRIRELNEGLKDIEDVICSHKTKLHEFLNTKEEEMVASKELIDKIVENNIEIIPKIALPDIKIKFSADKGDLVKIDQFINTMYIYSMEGTDKEDKTTTLKDHFLIENSWICHTCNYKNLTIMNRKTMPNLSKEIAKNKYAELCCIRCKSYKPVELYPSFYYNRETFSEEELEILNKRRNYERKNVSKKDSHYNQKNQEWFIINAEWLKDWKMFVNNKR